MPSVPGGAQRRDERPFAVSAPFEEPAFDPALLTASGLEQVRANVRGEAPPAPISTLLGMRPIAADEGSATFALPASGWLDGAEGGPQPGVLAPLADAAHAAAVVTTLGPGNALATISLTLSYVAPVVPRGDRFLCRARVDRGGAGMPVRTTAEVTAADGTVIAYSTARNVVSPIPGLDLDGPPGDRTGRRPPSGDVATPAPGPFDGADGDGATPPAIGRLTGLRAVEVGGGAARFELPATPWVSSLLRQVQGGALLMLAEAALDGAVGTALEPGAARGTLEVQVDFMRKVPAGEELLHADASLVQRGRSVAFGSCTVASDRRELVATARSVHRV